MFSPEPGIVFTEPAGRDLSDIANYTSLKWGERQLDAYRALLWKALMTIRQNPQIGRETGASSKKYRAYPAGEHVIFYRVKDEVIYVYRILHKRMDKKRHL
jgi:toxin ParE1/3/4